MIQVKGYRILVKPILLKESDKDYKRAAAMGLEVIRDPTTTAREHESVDQGVVTAIGFGAFKADDFYGEEWAKVGDTIVYARGAGKLVIDPETQEKYIVINDTDVVAVLQNAN